MARLLSFLRKLRRRSFRMSRTLFWYVFKDLLKIFLTASGALAGIMSFGGLLRPLTQNGLDGAQVLLLIRYSLPAMSTYSLPVAALFATTWVYGRMAADNEVTACRASGISFLAMCAPAMLLGIFVSVLSLYMLCFTVPWDTLNIERVVVSNIGKVIVHQIEQTHETHFGFFTVFAQEAKMLDTDPNKPNQQAVLLRGPMIVSFAKPKPNDLWFNVAKEFYMAREAIAYIDQDPQEGSAKLTVQLTDGVKFPRRFSGPKSEQGGVAAAEFGPVDVPSRLGQKTKFMDIFALKQLERAPELGQEVQNVTRAFIAADQAATFNRQIAAALNSPAGRWVVQLGGDTFTVSRADPIAGVQGGSVVMSSNKGGRPIVFRQESGGQVRLTAEARAAHIDTDADNAHDQLIVTVTLQDVLVDSGDTQTPKTELPRRLVLPMSPEIAAMKARTPQDYIQASAYPGQQRQKLWFEWNDLINHVSSELHARAAFVVSCLLLVCVGASLGMMFRSGNFLTAFAVSVVPAMLSVVLIVTGQHTAESTPANIGVGGANPLAVGIAVIWAGNVMIGAAAIGLLTWLQRQ
jgi:lipopolysaccharide export LptBFGC system permease protein LptF